MLLTRSPLSPGPKSRFSLDLHVLSAPPAFVLSQDQTLREELVAGAHSRRSLADKLLSSLELELKCLSARRDATSPEGQETLSVRHRRENRHVRERTVTV